MLLFESELILLLRSSNPSFSPSIRSQALYSFWLTCFECSSPIGITVHHNSKGEFSRNTVEPLMDSLVVAAKEKFRGTSF